jgi:prepilin-type processing-associated H-X9-DG protein
MWDHISTNVKDFSHVPGGGNVVYLDGHAGFLTYPGDRFPMTEDSARLRWLSIIPFGVLFMIGLYRQRAGSALGEPTGFLVILLGLTVVLAVMRLANRDPRTRAGIAAVQAQHAKASRLRRAPQPEEAALAVALFGTAVLVGTPWEPVHAMRQPASGDSGGSSDSGGDSSSDSSDGGSGCGGGGCGGCGG